MSDQIIEDMEFYLRYVAGGVKDKGREILENYEITPPQFVALQWVSDEMGITIGTISSKMHLAHSTTTDMIDRLEKLGVVERKKDETDRRVVRVYILPEGEKVIREVIDKRRAYLKDLFHEVDEEELQEFRTLMKHVYEKMSKLTN
ncbi:MarR family transcriptional regulator [Salimicrobium jeotgali]|uniref:MarR family transcriptional regulator n=3 Tax=Salimicrobium TaxID=351195 RepID=K2GAR8_9BACI|nr:MarR family transcriptional regulator [Salimicrobium jeotgali]MBM7695759.1 DNA-binding MarR family transcriptional regulator [Salimicrobium jeotgali]PBB06755.1 MarR family transcriptional regulator [Salimicrobium humidisoli]